MASVGGVDLGSAYVNVVPSTRDFGSRLRRQVLPDVARLGVAIRKTMAEAISDGVSDGVDEGTDEGKKHVASAAKQYGEVVEKLFGKGTADGIKQGLQAGKKESAKEGAESGTVYGSAFGKAVQTRVKRALESLPSADIEIDDTEAKARLEAIRAELKSMDDQRIGIDISAAEARRKILFVEAELQALAAKDVDIQVNADVGAALAQIAALRIAADDNRNAFQRMGGSIAGMIPNARQFGNLMNRSSLTMGQMVILASTLGTTLIPVAASAGALAAALVAPLAGAGIGLGAFATVAGLAIAQTEEQIKKIGKAKDAMLEERSALHKATAALAKHKKGTDAYKSALTAQQSAQKSYNEALEKYRGLLKGLSPMQRKFMKVQEGVKSAFDNLVQRNSKAIFKPMISGMRLLTKVMPKLDPLLKAVSWALSGLISQFRSAVQGGLLDRFVSWAAGTAPRAIKSLATIAGNAAIGVAGFFRAFQPTGFDLLDWLEDATAKFRRFGETADTNPAVQGFIEYIHDVGPVVADALADITKAIVHLLRAGAPLGTTLLKGLDKLAELLNAIPLEVLTAGWVGLTGAMISYKVAALASAAATKLASASFFDLASVRMAGLAAGIGVIAYNFSKMDSNTSGAERAMRGFTNVAAGALAGLSVGGPWGAAVGGAAGLIATFGTKTESATDKFEAQQKSLINSTTAYRKFKARTEDASAEVSTLTDMLDQNTGALTKNARKMLMKDFIDEGGLALAKDAGVSLAVVQKALLGNADAMKKLKKYPLSKITTQGQAVALNKLMALLGVQQDNIKAARKNIRVRNQMTDATKAYNKIVKQVPEKVITRLSLLGPKEAEKAAKKVQKRYDLTPKQVRTLLLAADHTQKEVKSAEKRLSFVSRARKAFIDAKMRNFDMTKKQALELWKQAPKSRKALIRYQSDGWKSAISQAKQVAKAVSDAADSMFDMFRNAKGPVPPVKDYPGLGRASGGPVYGPGTGTSDSILARLSNGEFVMRAAAVKKYGTRFMSAINSNKFASGGQAGGTVLPGMGFGTGFRSLWNNEIEPTLNRLIRALRSSSSSTNYNYTPSPDTNRGKSKNVLKGFDFGDRNSGLMGGLNKGKDIIQGFEKGKDVLQGFVKGAKAWKSRTVGMQLAVGKSSKKLGRYWDVLRKGHLQPLDKKWEQLFSREFPRRLKGFEKSTSRTTDRVGKRLQGFQKGPVARLEKAWRSTMATDLPKATNTMDKRVRNTTQRTTKNLHSFGGVVRDDVPKAFRSGVTSVGKAWGKVRGSSAKPVRYVITDVLNGGLIKAFNKIAKFTDSDTMKKLSVGFAGGGYTGPGAKYQPAGVVHKGEYVINKESTNAIERDRPGLLSRLNGYARGGKVGGAGYHPPVNGNFPWNIDHDDAARSGVTWAYDIPMPEGTPVMAAWGGRVASVADLGGGSYGKYISINHPGGFSTWYAHLSKQLVSMGQQVQAGMRIALSGNTGGSTGPHLHFEGRGAPDVNPSGGGVGPVLPPWAQKIANNPDAWAKSLLSNKVQGAGFAGLNQGMLDKLTKPSADWAAQTLNAFAGSNAGSFGASVQGIWKSLMSTGYFSPQQAAGVMGNMKYESGFNPHITNGIGATGLVQWYPGSKLRDYLGDKPNSVANQVDTIVKQLRGIGPHPESGAGAALKATNTPERAALVFEQEFERHGGMDVRRQTAARAIFNQFKGTHDVGGFLAHGHMGINMSGEPEAVLTGDQWRDVSAHLPLGGGGGSWMLRITNWQEGLATMRHQARSEMGAERAHQRTVGRQ